jgi:hypothetical protein
MRKKKQNKKKKRCSKQPSVVTHLAPPPAPQMDILQYHQRLSSTAANGASVTLETVVNGRLLPSLTDDQNAFIENAEGVTKKHLDRKSKLMELLWTTLSSDDKLRPFTEMVHPSSAPKMQAGAYFDNPMPMVHRLYDICGGVKAHYKLNILNEVMCCFMMKNAMLRNGSNLVLLP